MPEEQPHKIEDRLLLLQLQANSSEAFNTLYEKYWEQVYADAFRRLQDPAYAKDITQDIFMQLWLRRHELKIDNLPAYLFTAVRNNVFKWLEREQKYIPIPELFQQLETTRDKADAAILKKEFMAAYEALIAALTPSQQLIFKMRYQRDLSTGDIAEQLNISRKTVQNQLGKCLLRLREALLLFVCLLALYCSYYTG